VLKAALNYAYREGRLPSDDSWRRVRPFPAVYASRVRWLSEDECRRLLNAASVDLRALIRSALETGARYGELTRMRVADFDPDSGSLFVGASKSGHARYIPLDRSGRESLTTMVAGRPKDAHILIRADGRPWGRDHQHRPLLEACRNARIDPPASFHVLRHTYASHRIMKGAPLIVIAQALGHGDTRMVEKHYGHLARSYVQEVIEATGMDLEGDASDVVAMEARRRS
jgi:integrase